MDDSIIDRARKRCGILADVDWGTLCSSASSLSDTLRQWATALDEHDFNPVMACAEATEGRYSWGDLEQTGRDSWSRFARELKKVANG